MLLIQRVILILTIIGAVGCSSSPDFDAQPAKNTTLSPVEKQTTRAYMSVYNEWQGVPYRFGGTSVNGVDCSAFVQIAVLNATQQALPRTTLDQSKQGIEIAYEQAKSGDLVFFKTSPKVRHVGVYLGNKQFLHASTSKGVIISRLDNPYWASTFWHFRRI
ncbi:MULTISPECIES: C40 family peptidase [unclassified Vibrio]|uniref:C40 family peptidase n=1 Tax=unclassified Vibrio TaxID=2614977 RepID=UPI002556446F|nr:MULTISPECIES: NlpC/P60 family protein [unclassified Vibrio]